MEQENAWDIRLADLSVGYPGLVVLDGIDARLPAGRISVILGGSGCGKSTLLRHILGLHRPLRGSIEVGGQDIFKLDRNAFRSLRRTMGVVFQDGALLGSLTLAQNVALPLEERTRLSKDQVRDKVAVKLHLVGLEEFSGYYPSQLSGGMRKRAGLARAIIMEPTLLLCDEPTSGLDPINAAMMDQLLLDMKMRFNVTIVVVSHDLQSLSAIADYVLVLHQGKAAYKGELAPLLATADPYLRQFLDRKPDAGVLAREMPNSPLQASHGG